MEILMEKYAWKAKIVDGKIEEYIERHNNRHGW
jgi:L-rhamnose mutarotase